MITRKISKFFALLLAFVVLFGNLFSVNALFEPATPLNSEAAYLVNLDSGTVIYKKNETRRMYPASLTKVMTAIITLETVPDIDVMVTAPAYIYDDLYGKNASTADIRKNEQISVRELLYALLLPSACEAASILADYVGGGSIDNFLQMMNDKATQLGCTGTNFVNPHGLHDDRQYSTAEDMFKIFSHAITLPNFVEIASTPSYQIKANNVHDEPRTIVHTNRLLSRGSTYYNPYVSASKTGLTDQSGRNLVTLAQKDGYRYVLITMGAPTYDANGQQLQEILSFVDHNNVYDWIFDQFEVQKIATPEQIVASTKVIAGKKKDFVNLTTSEDITCLLPKNIDMTTVQQVADVPEQLKAPIKKGDLVGTIEFRLADEVIATGNLVAYEDIERSQILYIYESLKSLLGSIWFKLLFGLILLLIILYVAVTILYNLKKKKRGFYTKRRPRRRYKQRRYRYKRRF